MSLRRALLAFLLVLPVLAVAVPFAAGPAASEFVEGRDYITLAEPQPTTSGSSIEVREFFYYGCPHCFDFEQPLEAWLKRKPADVAFIRSPAAFNPVWKLNAQAYFVAVELGVEEKMTPALFRAWHVQNAKLTTKESIAAVFAANGVAGDRFEAAWNAYSVKTSLANADALARKYQVRGTPAMTVNGRYMVPAGGARSLQVVDFLIERERAARK
jgi:thiol:disulfide interchange protein DsbA